MKIRCTKSGRVPAISLNVVALPPKKRKQKGAEGFKVTWRKRDRNGNIIPQHLNLLALVSSQELRNYTKMKFLRRSQILILRDLLSSVTVPASPEVEETPTMSAWTQRQLTAQRRFRAAMPELLNCKLAAETVTKKFCQQCKTADAVVRCLDCVPSGTQFLCPACDSTVHKKHVFHDREAMTGGFFQPIPPTSSVMIDQSGQHQLAEQVCVLPIPLPLQVCTCGTDQDFTIVPGKQTVLVTINGRADMITVLAMGWNHRKIESLHKTLAKRFVKTTQRAELEAANLLNLKQELNISQEDTEQWVEDVKQWAATERPGADRSHEELQREIDDMIYSLRRKKHDLYRQNDSNKTRQRKRRRLTESKKKLRERIMQYNDAAAEKIDIDAACSLSEDVILPWDVQGDESSEKSYELTNGNVTQQYVSAHARLHPKHSGCYGDRCTIGPPGGSSWSVALLPHSLSTCTRPRLARTGERTEADTLSSTTGPLDPSGHYGYYSSRSEAANCHPTNITTFFEGTFPGLIKLREDTFQCPLCPKSLTNSRYSSSSDRSSTTNADPTTTNADTTCRSTTYTSSASGSTIDARGFTPGDSGATGQLRKDGNSSEQPQISEVRTRDVKERGEKAEQSNVNECVDIAAEKTVNTPNNNNEDVSSDGCMDEVFDEVSQCKQRPDHQKASEKQLEELQIQEKELKEKSSLSSTMRYALRSRKKKTEKIFPVIIRGPNLEYKPWQSTDMSDILEKLPTLQKCGCVE
ncbi:hypothetical protein D9C73_025296 [Collichthys lucidus]|uniref:Uncharacterized protein n=1 Tax=Collichthys lucidus TaxID=240159 RepID=A0A4V6AT76_COLLU|nr:hypothetical protein D9C73_025296 [Collichthys lucidus]